ncbi:unnamed protein product [Rotaria sordida]|uniref:NodB homology domain-containing protein n=2 Tax=Rotaria sordida TaxID=392033 RepID=A0A818ZRC5_9BILA|nr:unnamed protein product [Rotaria sordida]
MDLILKRPLAMIHQLQRQHSFLTIENVKEILDETVLFLNTTNNRANGLHELATICHELASVHMLIPFDNIEIIKHEFFIILGRTFEMLLSKARLISMTKADEQYFYDLSYFIVNLCLHKNIAASNFFIANNEKLNPNNEEKYDPVSYQKIFFTKSFFQKFIKIITHDLIINDYQPFHVKYKVTHSLLRLCIELNEIDHSLLIDPIIQCLNSNFYFNTFKTIDLRQAIFNPKQLFFICECPEFIIQRCLKQQDQLSNLLCLPMLEYSRDILRQHLPVSLEGEDLENIVCIRGAKIQAISLHIKLLNHFALTPTTRKYFIGKNRRIIDQMVMILSQPSLIDSVTHNHQLFHADVGMVSYAITLLYNLIFEKKIFFRLKENETILDACYRLQKANDQTIKFGSYTLSAILKQKDIDEINNPSKTAQTYLFYIENMIDEPSRIYHGVKLNGVLTNLEIIVQNDQIKEEIANDDQGIQLIAKCAYGKDFDDDIRHPALRIILSVSFAGDVAIEKIKNIDPLLDYVHDEFISNNAKQRWTANAIQWKIDEEKKFIKNQEENKEKDQEIIEYIKPSVKFDESKALYQYIRGDHRFDLSDFQIEDTHVMISYCLDDKEICDQIFDKLKTVKHYQLWMNKQYLHSANPEVVASAMEKADIVIMCFSNKYRESSVCRLEGEYAHKRKRPFIPSYARNQANMMQVLQAGKRKSVVKILYMPTVSAKRVMAQKNTKFSTTPSKKTNTVSKSTTTKPSPKPTNIQIQSTTNNILLEQSHFQVSEKFIIFWLESNLNNLNEKLISQIRSIVNTIKFFTDIDQCVKTLIEIKDVKIFLIVSNSLAQQIVPVAQQFIQVDSIYIFSNHKSINEQWSKAYIKIKGNFNQIEALCNVLKERVHQLNNDFIPISIVPESSIDNLNSVDPLFMYFQLFKENILTIEYDYEMEQQQLVDYCRPRYQETEKDTKIFDQFKQIENWLWEVNLILTGDKDPLLTRLTDHMRLSLGDGNGWRRLGQLMIKMGEFKKAEEIYNTLLKRISCDDKTECAFLHNQLGYVCKQQGDLAEALSNYTHSLEISQSSMSSNDPRLSSTYSNIGGILKKQGELDRALKYYEHALKIDLGMPEPNPLETAIDYNNIGSVFDDQKKYPEALKNYKEALEIKRDYLPPHHPSLATTYSNIGLVYRNMDDSSTALLYYQQALEIQKKSLLSNHPSLIVTHGNMAGALESLKRYNEAIEHAQRAVDIAKHAFGPNHAEWQKREKYLEELQRKY